MKHLSSKLATPLALLVVLGLTACGGPRGGLSLSVNASGDLLVGACDSEVVTDVSVSVFPKENSEWEDVLDSAGPGYPIEKGDSWVLQVGLPGFEVKQSGELSHAPGDRIYILAITEGYNLRGSFTIPAEGLEPGAWLFPDPDNSTADCVCERYDNYRG